jgi:hypothetical protein
MSVDVQKIKDQVLQYSDQLERVKTEVRKVLVGQDLMVKNSDGFLHNIHCSLIKTISV